MNWTGSSSIAKLYLFRYKVICNMQLHILSALKVEKFEYKNLNVKSTIRKNLRHRNLLDSWKTAIR